MVTRSLGRIKSSATSHGEAARLILLAGESGVGQRLPRQVGEWRYLPKRSRRSALARHINARPYELRILPRCIGSRRHDGEACRNIRHGKPTEPLSALIAAPATDGLSGPVSSRLHLLAVSGKACANVGWDG